MKWISRVIDNMVESVDPKRALDRRLARNKLQFFNKGYSHHGASTAKKSLLGWMSSGGSPDDDITDNRDKLVERSRDLFMGAPLATGAAKTMRTNVVGAGIKLKAAVDYDALGISLEEANAWERRTEREFSFFAKTCDIRRKKDFYELQSLAYLSQMISGEVFVMLPFSRNPGDVYALKLMLLESDRINKPYSEPDDKVRGGIEEDANGAPLAYWVSDKHPKDKYAGNVKWVRVPAFGSISGRKNMLHVHEDERPGQRRGTPHLAPVIESLKQLTRYTEAEIMNAVITGMLTVFITSDAPEAALGDTIPDEQQVDADPGSIEIGNGTIVGLAPGEKPEFLNPTRVNTGFEAFVLALCRQIGAALEIPAELLVKHFTASYSASRAALLEFWKTVRTKRSWFISQFCQPIYEEWLAEAVASGRIEAAGFFDDPAIRAAWSGAEWYGQSQGQIDPLKEANAAVVRINNCLTTRAKEAAELTGGDFESIVDQQTREKTMMTERGLVTSGQVLENPSRSGDE